VKILLMRFSSLGDVVLATAAANAIKQVRPDAELVFLTKPAYAPLLQGQGALSEVWALKGGSLAMARRIRSARFDAVLDLQGKLRSRLFSAFSGARSVRMKNHALHRRLKVWFPALAAGAPPPVAERGVRAAAELLNFPFSGAVSLPSLALDGQAIAWVDRILKSHGVQDGETLIGFCPGAAWFTKRWHPGNYAQAMGLLAGPGRRFVFVGDAVDAALAKRIVAYARKGADQAIIAAGQTDLPQLAALLKRCHVLLSNDSGPMHVAGALGVPVVALFGPTVEAFGFFPQGPKSLVLQRELSCRPCSVHGTDTCPLGTHACMEKIAPFEVARAVEGMLA
jgi:heptosyltransferase-2